MLAINTPAPNFALKNAEGVTVSLSEKAGTWILLYFYPKDDTPGCTAEACSIRDAMPLYEDLHITVFGISKDSVESHRKFKEKYRLPFDLLSDEDGYVSQLYGAGAGETPKRISYLIAPDGTIVRAYEKVSPATHAQEVLKDMEGLK